jgi:hypothetical protein
VRSNNRAALYHLTGWLTASSLLAVGVAGARVPAEWDSSSRVSPRSESSASFPELAVDARGRVHVVWGESADPTTLDSKTSQAKRHQMFYAVLTERGWSEPRPIAVAQNLRYTGALAVDDGDVLHLVFSYSPQYGRQLYYRQAEAARGFQRGKWERSDRLSRGTTVHTSNIAVRGDTIHVLFDDDGPRSDIKWCCTDVYYVRSEDGGYSWSPRRSLRSTPTGATRARLAMDVEGVLHATWDEGWDPSSQSGRGDYGVYMLSPDGGENWSAPLLVSDPEAQTAQLTAASDGRGGVLLVWRNVTEYSSGYSFMWSLNWGESWSARSGIPGIQGAIGPRFDSFDMSVDRAGNIHLVLTGRRPDDPVHRHSGVYHLVWNGREWSPVLAVSEGEGSASYVRSALRDDALHVTFVVQRGAALHKAPGAIWYARARVLTDPSATLREARPLSRAVAPLASYAPVAAEDRESTVRTIEIDRTRLAVMAGCIAAGFVLVGVGDAVSRWRRGRT